MGLYHPVVHVCIHENRMYSNKRIYMHSHMSMYPYKRIHANRMYSYKRIYKHSHMSMYPYKRMYEHSLPSIRACVHIR